MRGEVHRLDGHRVRVVVDLRLESAHRPGQGQRTPRLGDHDVVGVERALHVVEGLQGLAGVRPPDGERTGQLRTVEGVQGLAELQHHVVGDVHGQGDRAHPARDERTAHPLRARGVGIQPGDRAQHEAVGGARVGDRAAVRGLPRRRREERLGVDQRRVGERQVVGGGHLAGDAADAQGVPAVGGDGDVEHLVAEAEDLVPGVAGRRRACGQDHDPVVVVTEGELALGGDHPVGHPAVGGTRRDLEPAGQDRTGQRHHDQVAGDEVARPADDPALGGRDPVDDLAVAGADLDPAEPDGLLELGELLDGQHPPDDQRARDLRTEDVDGLDLEPGGDQAGGDVAPGLVGGDVDVLADPAHGSAHDLRPPSRTPW